MIMLLGVVLFGHLEEANYIWYAGRATIASQTIYIIIYQIWFTKNVPNSQYIIIHVHVNYNVYNYTGKI